MFDSFSHFSKTALQIRIDFSSMKIMDFGSSSISRYELVDIYIEPKDSAWNLGFNNPTVPVPAFFNGTVLEKIYSEGQKERAYAIELAEDQEEWIKSGSQERWDALSPDEQFEHWEEFHERCLVGTADEMTFYDLMMSIHQIGYVGH